jgi:hypothetical protein
MLPAPLTSFAPTYMAHSALWRVRGVQRILEAPVSSVPVVGHVGNNPIRPEPA